MEHPKPTNSTIYRLYGSSQHCAFPGCTERHIGIDGNTGVKICNTEVCHIHARREYGPRWNPSQTAEDNRSDGNLLLLCRKHHSVVDDRRNEDYYTQEMLRVWKDKQEAQADNPLGPDDFEAIEQANVMIAAETVNLGGERGAAPGAGGGGGAAIGSNARGGRGGDGGRIFDSGRLAEGSAPVRWTELVQSDPRSRNPGAGGGGEPASGLDAVGGRGGDGGDINTFSQPLARGSYRVTIGRGAQLPGELGGATYFEKVNPDGSTELVMPKFFGGLSGDSYLQEGVPEIDAAAIDAGVRVCCLTVVEDVSTKDGAISVGRFGLSALTVAELPIEGVFTVLTTITKRSDWKMGYFVSLVFNSEEKARIAVNGKESDDSYTSWSYAFPIGAYFETEGEYRIIAHASGILLCETAFEIRLMR
jgi:hypothetical protein